MKNPPQGHRSRTPSGGQANVRGVLVQTLIGLIDALLGPTPCEWLTLEPDLESEKFDLLWKTDDGLVAVQVKTSINPFTKANVDAWTREMKSAADREAPGAHCRLIMVGHPATDLVRSDKWNEVAIEFRTQTEHEFIEQAAHRLHAYLDREDFSPVKAEFHVLLVNSLLSHLEQESIRASKVKASEFCDKLNRWVSESPHYQPEIGNANLATYFDHVIEQCDKLALSGIDSKSSDPSVAKRLALANVYIDLMTELRRPLRPEEKAAASEKTQRRGIAGADDSTEVSALEAAADHRRLVLTGQPGSGKTTFIRHLCLCLAQHFRKPTEGWLERLLQSGWRGPALVPIVVELRHFARSLPEKPAGQPSARDLWSFFTSPARRNETGSDLLMENFQGDLLRAITAGRALVIFEGLDEVPTGPRRHNVKQAIEAFASGAQFRASRIVVTCRSRAYKEAALHLTDRQDPAATTPTEFTTAPLKNFDPARILSFTQSWYRELAKFDKSHQSTAEFRADQLYRALQAPTLAPHAGRPMLLTVMANVHARNDKLPRDRAQVYAEMVGILAESWDNVRLGELAPLRRLLESAGKTQKDLLGFLSELAFHAHARDHASGSGRGALADIPKHGKYGLLETLATWCGSRDRAAELIEAIEQRAGLLVSPDPGSDVFQFPHRSFQEYLAGVHLADQDDFESQAVRLADADRIQKSDADGGDIGYWDEALKWAAGWIAHVSEGKRLWKEVPIVANLLCDAAEANPAVRRRKLGLAAELLTEMGPEKLNDSRTIGGSQCLQRVQRLLLERMTTPDLPAVERARSGRHLGRLGDPRPEIVPASVAELAAMKFCMVPAGPFWTGLDEVERKEIEGRYPIHQEALNLNRTLSSDFWVSQHPVTVAQFDHFLRAGGYDDARWWAEAIKLKLWKNGKVIGSFWDDKSNSIQKEWRERPGDSSGHFRIPNHPIVEVNWYEALAYCRWLGSVICLPDGYHFSLPSETQWEKAARGGEDLPASPIIRSLADGVAPHRRSTQVRNPINQRLFPWGDDFDSDRANCVEGQIRSVSAVGCFLRGASPYGLEDMAGNVWEWTRSLWGAAPWHSEYPYPYIPEDGRENLHAPVDIARVLRGGAWDSRALSARCAYRSRSYPDFRSRIIGFRVVASPLSTCNSET